MMKRHDYPTLLITKYMGSKKAILPFVAEELAKITEPGDILVDLMAGTHTIGYAMRERCKVIANDVQRFSSVIGETLLNYNPKDRFEGSVKDYFKRAFLLNMRHVGELFEFGLRREKNLLSPENPRPSWQAYRDFCEDYPYYQREKPAYGLPSDFTMLFSAKRVEAYRTLNKLEPYSLFSLFYANSYVGVRQAAEIDSLRCAIDKTCDQWLFENENPFERVGLRSLLLAALISVVNKINPSPGHWAAIPRVSQKNYKNLTKIRAIPLYDMFIQRVEEIEDEICRHPNPHTPHIVMTEDYLNFMDEVKEYIRQAKVVYLDPPYSQGHYSRFYHLLETLVQYDYPDIVFAGRYRSDRHQSPFGYREKVRFAVRKVCEIAIQGNAILVVSYSQGGVIPNSDAFREVLEEFYAPDKIHLKLLSSAHSKLGKMERMDTVEYLFTCYPS